MKKINFSVNKLHSMMRIYYKYLFVLDNKFMLDFFFNFKLILDF